MPVTQLKFTPCPASSPCGKTAASMWPTQTMFHLSLQMEPMYCGGLAALYMSASIMGGLMHPLNGHTLKQLCCYMWIVYNLLAAAYSLAFFTVEPLAP